MTNRLNSLIIGIGSTGQSVARHLTRLDQPFIAADTRDDRALIETWRAAFPQASLHIGPLDPAWLDGVDQVVVSPGVALEGPLFAAARAAGIPIRGDVDLCLEAAAMPCVLITGSNGKSTVTALVAALLDAIDIGKVGVGGNFGTPALDLLAEDPAVLVLEVSSFQLESTAPAHLHPRAATVLNISQDHLDRHGTLAHYAAIKSRVLTHAATALINRDDPVVAEMMSQAHGELVSFGSDAPASARDFGLCPFEGETWLCRGEEPLFRTAELGMTGRHNQLNVQAALALLTAVRPELDLHDQRIASVLSQFVGLPHRSQLVAEYGKIAFVNDSKATNVGAAVAALCGMNRPVVLIAGGQGKGQDFVPLAEALRDGGVAAVLIGVDRQVLAASLHAVLGTAFPVYTAETLEQAVEKAWTCARPGDAVLLAPACASLDMFPSYIARGEQFANAVKALIRRQSHEDGSIASEQARSAS